MRTSVRPAVAGAVALMILVGVGGIASADPNNPYPTKQQVDAAKQDVEKKTDDVAAIRARLVVAQNNLSAADTRAEVAAEAYNGAMWKLSQAKQAATKAQQAAAAAKAKVEAQRVEIARLVAQSYQEGNELGTVSALLSSEGPTGVMNRLGVVESAGDSLQAQYDQFTANEALAKVAAAKAAKAEKAEEGLAAQAKSARDQAASLAVAAQRAASQIAAERNKLIAELAKAQHVSVALATQRQKALEAIAAHKAALAAAAAAKKKAEEEAAAAAAAAKNNGNGDNGGSGTSSGGGDAPVVTDPAPVGSSAVQRAIAYAKAQLGKPYVWAASGPNSFDCSGLTMRAWQAGGISLPHYSVAQYQDSTPISIADARPGDLLFWSYNGRPSGIHHVALYLGNGEFIEAPHTGADVRYNNISDEYPDFVARP